MNRLCGVIAPILTPVTADGIIATELWVTHARWVLGEGAHYLSPFGTTGEALSLSISRRMAALETLVSAGIPAGSLMPGTGLCNLEGTVELTRHAVGLGVAGTMVLPSFFYVDAGEDGQFRYFSSLVEQVGDARLRICLYNIPQNSGVAISAALAKRLNVAFPDVFVAYKDSTGNWDNTRAVISTAPGVSVFPGTEVLMTRSMQQGGAGCISATVNLNAAVIRAVYERQLVGDGGGDLKNSMTAFRSLIQNAGLIPAMKAILAVRYDDERWLNLLPPLENATVEMGQALLQKLGSLADHILKPD